MRQMIPSLGLGSGDARRSEPAAEEWLLIEWPEGEDQPDHYWLSTLPADISLERMVDHTKLRWRIERDYLELKQEVGLAAWRTESTNGTVRTERRPHLDGVVNGSSGSAASQ